MSKFIGHQSTVCHVVYSQQELFNMHMLEFPVLHVLTTIQYCRPFQSLALLVYEFVLICIPAWWMAWENFSGAYVTEKFFMFLFKYFVHFNNWTVSSYCWLVRVWYIFQIQIIFQMYIYCKYILIDYHYFTSVFWRKKSVKFWWCPIYQWFL